jgi:hypothetical protein
VKGRMKGRVKERMKGRKGEKVGHERMKILIIRKGIY